jgi:diguanylate cyclase (GGDEF)-like protein
MRPARPTDPQLDQVDQPGLSDYLQQLRRRRSVVDLTPEERTQLVEGQVSATRPIVSGVLLSGGLILSLTGGLQALGLAPGIGYPWWLVEVVSFIVACMALGVWHLSDWRLRLLLTLASVALVGIFMSLPLPGISTQLAIRTALFQLMPIALLAMFARRTSVAATIAVVLALAFMRVSLHGDPASGSALYWLFEVTGIGFGLMLGAYRVDFAVATFRMRTRLRQQATVDELTQLMNRTGWNSEAATIYADAVTRGERVSLVFLDIDFFKRVNDEHGLEVGDRILQGLGLILTERMAPRSLCARMGGEEFVAIFVDQSPESVEGFVQRVRTEFESWSAELAPVTLSAGIAHRLPTETMAQQLKRADLALYEAKAQGRNQAVVAGTG